MDEKYKSLIKNTLALLGGILTALAIIEPWITEKYYLLRFKCLVTVVILFVVYNLIKITRRRVLKYLLGVTFFLGLLVCWLGTPTLPMNLLSWVPSPEDREFLKYNDDLSPLKAYKAGMIHILNNEQSEAKLAFEKSLKDQRLKPYALNRLAFVVRLQGDDEKSLELYNEAIKYSSKAELRSERKTLLSNNYQNRGFIYRRLAHAVRNDKVKWSSLQKKAFRSFQNSLDHDPTFYKSWYMMGQIHYDRGELDAAKEAYYQAYYLNSQYDRAAYNLASLAADMGDIEQSLKWVKRTLQINASQVYAIEDDESFKQLRLNDTFINLINDAKERLEVIYQKQIHPEQKVPTGDK